MARISNWILKGHKYIEYYFFLLRKPSVRQHNIFLRRLNSSAPECGAKVPGSNPAPSHVPSPRHVQGGLPPVATGICTVPWVDLSGAAEVHIQKLHQVPKFYRKRKDSRGGDKFVTPIWQISYRHSASYPTLLNKQEWTHSANDATKRGKTISKIFVMVSFLQ